MSNFLRRLALSRLLLLCGVLIGVGIGATALATALGVGPAPPPKPLAQAVHDALSQAAGEPIEGVSAQIQLTNHLLEGASLASGGGGEASQLSSSPLLSGASGRLWISKDGRLRLELQSEKGDTQIYFDGHTVSMYDASSNTLYRYTIPAHDGSSSAGGGSTAEGSSPGGGSWSGSAADHEVPSVAKVEAAIAHLNTHANVSGATPTDVAGQAAYTVRVSPKEGGSLLGGAELSWDAVNGVPLRAAVYSTSSSSPVLELAATEVSYGPVAASVFEFTPPANAKIDEMVLPEKHGSKPADSTQGGEHPHLTSQGHGLATIGVLESKVGQTAATAGSGAGQSSPALPEGLPQVKINGTTATELSTELGTLLTFERSGVRYLVAGAVSPSTVEAVAKGL
jgi:outer membrane lipoprotein-sorting protein